MTTSAAESDPLDSRPIIMFVPTSAERTIWGLVAAVGVLFACALIAAFLVCTANHRPPAVLAGVGFLIVMSAVLLVHTLRNPPAGLAVNLDTRKYHLIKGAGRFRASFRGTFDDIRAVACIADESSHGVSAYRIVVRFSTAARSCIVESHGPAAAAIARERASRLAEILGVGTDEPH